MKSIDLKMTFGIRLHQHLKFYDPGLTPPPHINKLTIVGEIALHTNRIHDLASPTSMRRMRTATLQ